MKLLVTYIFILSAVISSGQLSYAQKKDSTKTKFYASDVRYVTIEYLSLDSQTYSRIDTSLEGFSNYLPRNKNDEIKTDLGNPGSASRLLMGFPTLHPGYNLGMNRYQDYMTRPEDLALYNTGPRFTNISYGSGVGKAQFFEVSHGQNITPLISFGLDYNKVNAKGLYTAETNDHTTVDIYFWYKSPKERYQAVTGFIFNRIIAQENGGIVNDSLFLKARILQPEFEPYKLAEGVNNVIEKQFFINQSYSIGALDTLSDSTLKLKKGLTLNFDFKVKEGRHYYRDGSRLSYYENVYFDSVKTNNNLTDLVFNQKYYISLNKPFNLPLSGRVGLEQNDVNLTVYREDSVINETKAFADARLNLNKNIALSGSLERVILGRQYDDQSLRLGAEFNLSERIGKVSGELYVGQAQPTFVYQYYRGNNFIWSNSFEKQSHRRVSLNYSLSRLKLNLGLNSGVVTNHVFVDFSGHPKQINESLNFTKITLKKDFSLGDFTMENYYAGMLVNPAILRIPDHYFRHSFYFTKPLFKKALTFQTGLELIYFSKVAGFGYLPTTTLFYNIDGFETGGYPLTSFFIHAQVKRVRFFGRVTNLTQGILGEGMFNFYGYPIQDRGISLGLSWDFLD